LVSKQIVYLRIELQLYPMTGTNDDKMLNLDVDITSLGSMCPWF